MDEEYILFKLLRMITCIAKDNALLPRWERSLGLPIFPRYFFVLRSCLMDVVW